jgi:predicted nuclease of predicted toxin-antitoxin system
VKRVLFDNATPRKLARFLINHHSVTEARAYGWAELENGNLLREVEAVGFEVLVTPDKDMLDQQNFTGRKLALVVLGQGKWPWIKPYVASNSNFASLHSTSEP